MASVTVKQEPLDSSEIDTRWISLVHAIILKTTMSRLCRHAVSVSLSVRLSRSYMDSVETNKHILIFFTIG